MAGPLHYHRRYHSDILNAYVGMPLELRGAYDTILELLYERMRALPNDPKWLSRWLECSSRKTQSLIEELVERGKIYLTTDGMISNKRFEIEAKDREEWSKTSSNSAAKRWRKYREQHADDNKINCVEVKSHSNGNAIQQNLNYNGNSNSTLVSQVRRESARLVIDPFDLLWLEYPKREGSNPKKPARLAFARQVAKGTDPQTIIDGAKRYGAFVRERGEEGGRFVAQTVTWLNQERWNDEYENAAATLANSERERLQRILAS